MYSHSSKDVIHSYDGVVLTLLVMEGVLLHPKGCCWYATFLISICLPINSNVTPLCFYDRYMHITGGVACSSYCKHSVVGHAKAYCCRSGSFYEATQLWTRDRDN